MLSLAGKSSSRFCRQAAIVIGESGSEKVNSQIYKLQFSSVAAGDAVSLSPLLRLIIGDEF